MPMYLEKYRYFVSLWQIFGVLFGLSFLLAAQAAPAPILYQGEAPVASASPEDWQKALVPALQQVFIRVSGNANIVQDTAVRKAMIKPAALVQSYNYIMVDNGAAGKTQILQVRFSPKGVDGVLSAARQPVVAADTNMRVLAQNTAGQLIQMQVTSVNGLKDYTDLYTYLRHLNGVADINTTQMSGSQVTLAIKATGSADALTQQIAMEGKLVAQPSADSQASSALQYRWAGAVVSPAVNKPLSPPAAVVPPSPQQPIMAKEAAPVVEGVPAPFASETEAAATAAPVAQSFAAPSDHHFTPDASTVPEEVSLY